MKTSYYYALTVLIFFACSCNQSQNSKTEVCNTEITISSYNIRFNNPNDGDNAWPNRQDQVKALIRYHDFDIFGIQEGLSGQLSDLSEMNEFAYIGVGRDDGKISGEYSAIFFKTERFKLLDSGNFWLSETPEKPSYGWDAKYRRICSWGFFKDRETAKEFYVFNAHFDHQAEEARIQSGLLMVEKMKEIAGNNHVVCMGDFNSTPETEQIKTLNSLLQDAFTISKLPPYGSVGTFNGFDYNATMDNRIDYIFVSKKIEVLKYAALTDSYHRKFPSDHLPVVAKILIE